MSDKTEAPTTSKLEEARNEGNVVRSIELNTAAIMLVSILLLLGPGRQLIQAIQTLLIQFITELPQANITEDWLRQITISAVVRILPNLGMILAGLLVTGVVVTEVQTGFLWANKRIGFDFKRVNPLTGFQRIFSPRSLVELVKALLKLSVVGFTAYGYLRSNYTALLALNQTDIRSALQRFGDLASALGLRIGGAYLIIAAADYAYQRWDVMRNLRMTKQEIKEEIKRSEGDPYVKNRIRQQQRRMARGRMMANVPKATVVVTNPTHLALAIEYRSDMAAPRLLAKGAHKVAERIVAIARENKIPTVQNIPLAHAIYDSVEIEHEIPPDLYKAMAEVLAYVYRMYGKNKRSLQSTVNS